MNGAPVAERDGFTLEVGGDAIARIVLGWDSARARRRVGDLAKAAWVPVEVSRLRLVLRDALEEARASRARLAEAGADERRRIERDLHDGAQQRIVATGMRLRLLQQRLPSRARRLRSMRPWPNCSRRSTSCAGSPAALRPSRLDDGLEAALSVTARGDADPVRPPSRRAARHRRHPRADRLPRRLRGGRQRTQARRRLTHRSHRGEQRRPARGSGGRRRYRRRTLATHRYPLSATASSRSEAPWDRERTGEGTTITAVI